MIFKKTVIRVYFKDQMLMICFLKIFEKLKIINKFATLLLLKLIVVHTIMLYFTLLSKYSRLCTIGLM